MGWPIRAEVVGVDRLLINAPREYVLGFVAEAAIRIGVAADGLALESFDRALANDPLGYTLVVLSARRPPSTTWRLETLKATVVALAHEFNRMELDDDGPGEPVASDEMVVRVFVETEDEDVFREVVKHVEELADHLGYGLPLRVG